MESSEAPRMDPSDLECELTIDSAEGSAQYPDGQELLTDLQDRPERENLTTTNETCSSEDNSLFQDPSRYSPTRTRRIRSNKGQTSSCMDLTSDDSSDFLPMAQKIADYLKQPSRKWRKRKKKGKRSKYLARKKGPRRVTKRKSCSSISLEERRRRLIDQGIQFPFIPLKHLPFKLYFEYEQFVLGGFLNHIKNLKYDHSLKESLKDMEMDEDLEDLQMRKYSYLDEDGPLSPISEPGENLNEDEEEREVEVVETSTFVLGSQVPSKENWQIKRKRGKKSLRNKT